MKFSRKMGEEQFLSILQSASHSSSRRLAGGIPRPGEIKKGRKQKKKQANRKKITTESKGSASEAHILRDSAQNTNRMESSY